MDATATNRTRHTGLGNRGTFSLTHCEEMGGILETSLGTAHCWAVLARKSLQWCFFIQQNAGSNSVLKSLPGGRGGGGHTCERSSEHMHTRQDMWANCEKSAWYVFSGCREYTYIDTYLYLYRAPHSVHRPLYFFFFPASRQKKKIKQSYMVVIAWTNCPPLEHCFCFYTRFLFLTKIRTQQQSTISNNVHTSNTQLGYKTSVPLYMWRVYVGGENKKRLPRIALPCSYWPPFVLLRLRHTTNATRRQREQLE